jgi:ribosome-associated protein
MLNISQKVTIPESELDIRAIRAQGAGGQNVNKVATAIHLRFDIKASSLPDFYKKRLLNLRDARITKEGVIIIKSQQYRSQEKNKDAALKRLQQIISSVKATRKKRIATKPTKNSQQKRLDSKTKHSRLKKLRGKLTTGED